MGLDEFEGGWRLSVGCLAKVHRQEYQALDGNTHSQEFCALKIDLRLLLP